MKVRPYPEYKDSGVPWLGEIPRQWKILSVRQIGHLFKGSGGNKNDEVRKGVPCVRYGDLYTTHKFFILNTRACISPDNLKNYTRIRFGDVLFAASGETIEDIGRSAVNLILGEACCGGDIIVLRPTVKIDSRFLGYALDSPTARYQKSSMGRGFTVVHIYGTALKSLAVALPPLGEQIQIARFLDWKTAQIDRFIRAKRQLIERLKEYKQTLINQAVSGQIDVRTGKPYPEYKDSGVPWLGEVPVGWEVLPLKRLADFKSGVGFPIEHQGTEGEDLLFIKVSDMSLEGNEEQITTANNSVSRITAKALGAFVFPVGSIIFPKVGGALLTNKRRTLARPSCIDNNIMGCIPKDSTGGGFIFLLLSQLDLSLIAKPGPVPAISEGEVKNISVQWPPFQERVVILDYVEYNTRKIDKAIARTQRQIDLIQEYRTRLIADVVTGKLDVRGVAVPDQNERSDADPDAAGFEEVAGEEGPAAVAQA